MNKMYLVIHRDDHFGAKYKLYTSRESALKRADKTVSKIIKKRPFLEDDIENWPLKSPCIFGVSLGEEYGRSVSVLELDANP